MALDNEYFDAINIDVVKKKYYNANKVEAVLSDIREKAAALNTENAALRSQLEELGGSKDAIGDLLISVKKIAAQMLLDAQEQADEITAQAQKKAAAITADAQRDADNALSNTKHNLEESVARMEECYANMKQHHLDCIDAINLEWQNFLCSLYSDEEIDCGVPEDLSQKVGAIAKELEQIEEDAPQQDYIDDEVPSDLLMLNDFIEQCNRNEE